MSSLVAQKSSMNRRTLMRQNLRRSVQQPNGPVVSRPTNVNRSTEKNKEQIKQRAIKEMTKTWESSTNLSRDDKNSGFRRIANLALQKYKASLRFVFKYLVSPRISLANAPTNQI